MTDDSNNNNNKIIPNKGLYEKMTHNKPFNLRELCQARC